MKFNKNINQKGFSLIETLIVLAISASVLSYTLVKQSESIREDAGKNFGRKLSNIIQTLDNRFFVDGYDERNFIDVDGNVLDKDLKYPFTSFIKEQLYTNNHPCVSTIGSNWEPDPDAPANTYYGLTDCNLFPNDILPFKIKNAEVSFEITYFGGLNAVKRINFDFDISESKEFIKEFTFAIENAKKLDVQHRNGMHEFYFFNPNATTGDDERISAKTCLELIESSNDCYIRAAIDTLASDGSEYAKVNGANNYRGSLKFAASPDGDVAAGEVKNCFIWSYTPSTDTWDLMEVSEDEMNPSAPMTTEIPCGIQYYEGEDENGDTSQVVSFTARDISLNRSIAIDSVCDSSKFNNVPNQTTKNPYLNQVSFNCGMFNSDDGTGNLNVIAIVDDIYAARVFAQQINAENIDSTTLNSVNINNTGKFNFNDNNTNMLLGLDTTKQSNPDSIGNIDPTFNGLSFSGNDVRLKVNNSVVIDGVTNIINKNAITTDKEINDFVNPKELVSKEYVDTVSGIFIRYKNTLQLNDTITRISMTDPVPAGEYFRECPTGYTQREEVSPVITYGEPVTVTYGLSQSGNIYSVEIDKDTNSESNYPWPTGATRPWANVTILCVIN